MVEKLAETRSRLKPNQLRHTQNLSIFDGFNPKNGKTYRRGACLDRSEEKKVANQRYRGLFIRNGVLIVPEGI